MDDLDRAILFATGVNNPDGLDVRRKELKARLRNDPTTVAKPQFTDEEMRNAAARVMASVFKSGKLPPQ